MDPCHAKRASWKQERKQVNGFEARVLFVNQQFGNSLVRKQPHRLLDGFGCKIS
jgi:hypothetical protein